MLAPDDWVKAPSLCHLGQIGAQRIEVWRLRLALGRTLTRGGAGTLLGAPSRTVAQDPHDLVAYLLKGDTHNVEYTSCNSLTITDKAQEEMLRADIVVIQPIGLLDSILDHLLRPRGQLLIRDRIALPYTNDKFYGTTGLSQLDPQIIENTCGNAFALTDQAEQNMLSTNVGVVE